jgi:hypothetical protein
MIRFFLPKKDFACLFSDVLAAKCPPCPWRTWRRAMPPSPARTPSPGSACRDTGRASLQMHLGLSFPGLPRLRHQRGEAVIRGARAHGGVAEAIEVRVKVALEGGVALVLGRRAHGRRRTCRSRHLLLPSVQHGSGRGQLAWSRVTT